MIPFLIRTMPSVLFVLAVSSVVAFSLPRLAPGDIAVLLAGVDPTAEDIATIRAQLGLDRSLIAQYGDWISGLLQGDLGHSFLLRRDVSTLIGDRLGSTVELAVASLLLVIVIGAALGLAAGSVRRPWIRAPLDLLNSLLIAIPSFLVGLALILVFGIFNHWLPVSGEASVLEDPVRGLSYLVLPALALALTPAAIVGRFVATEMATLRQSDFVDLAVSKGVSRRRTTLRHVFRNSLGSAAVAVGLQIGNVLAGAIIIEAIFARRGLGQLAVSSLRTRDFPTLQVLIVFGVAVAVFSQLLTQLVLARLDPRIRLED